MRVMIAALVAALAGAGALAHSGATGVVMERMMGMSAMQEVIRDLAPMMRGEVPYDADAVREGAAAVTSHSGATMRALFPEGGEMAASFAKPEIWTQWEDFERMSSELDLYAAGLGAAAPNGLEAPAPAGMPMSPRMNDMMPEREPPRLTVAQLMGVEPRPDARQAASATDDGSGSGGINFATMAADDVFEMLGQTCSACHAQFRSGN